MPTDPPPAHQRNPSGPLGQPQPSAQQLPHQQHIPYQFAQQQQPHLPLYSSHQPNTLQHSQYAISGQPPLHSSQQPPPQRQPPQSHQQQQQSRAQMTQQQNSYFPVNGFQPQLGSYSGPQYPVGGMMYPSATPYGYQLPVTNLPQQQGHVGPRPQRQFPQNIPPTSSQRTPSRPIPVPPPRKKNILQIVDPDTNEEVKVSKVDARQAVKSVTPPTPTPHPPVEIPPRRSHALKLVSDPADDRKSDHGTVEPTASISQQTSIKASQDATAADAIPKTKESTTEIHTISVEQSTSRDETADSASAKEAKVTPAVRPMVAESSSGAVQGQQPAAVAADEAKEMTTPSTLNQVEKSDKPVFDPQLVVAAEAAQAQDAVVDTTVRTSRPIETSSGQEAARSLSGSAPSGTEVNLNDSNLTKDGGDVSKRPASTEAQKVVDDEVRPGDTAMSIPEEAAAPTVSATDVSDHRSGSAVTERSSDAVEPTMGPTSLNSSLPNETSKEIGPTPNVEEETNTKPDKLETSMPEDHDVPDEGQRRVYIPTFMWHMKEMQSSQNASEYETALSSRDLLKNGPSNLRRNDSRGNRSGRSGTSPMSTDPRLAFPGQGGQMGPMRRTAPPGLGPMGLGAYDAFDLRSARSQAPPPAPKGATSARDGDPRGSRQQGSRGRFDGPSRQGQAPLDPFVLHPPLEKLKRSDKGWKRNRDADDEVTTKVKTVRSLLNKLTLEKFEKIFKQIVDVDISSFAVLDGVVTEIFEKTLFEPKFSAMYAELCRRLGVTLHDALAKANIADADGKPITFRKILLNHCREEFTRFAQSVEAYERSDSLAATENAEGASENKPSTEEGLSPAQKEAKEKQKKEEEAMKATKAKRRMLANVRFIGELYLKDLLRERTIHEQCIQKLLSLGIEKKEEDTLEALCKLISKTGAKLSENKDALDHIDSYFSRLRALSVDHSLPARIRFMLQDLLEQRSNNWKVRREEVGAKTIAEIHREVEKEERAKQEAQAAARERRNRGGSMHNRDRGQNFVPRVSMTMASNRRPGPNVSRTNSVIEKFGNRGAAPASNSSFQSFRLGPGGAGGSGSGALRPGSGSGMFGSFAALTDIRDSSLNGQSGDVRRGKVTKQPISQRRAPTKPQAMTSEKLKQKSRSMIKEFWSNGLVGEVRQTLAEEFHAMNYSGFLEEAILTSVNAKVDDSEKSIQLFHELVNAPLSDTDLVHGFSACVAQLTDLEVDNPRAGEFLGKYIGTVASTRKLPRGTDPGFGLDFVAEAIPATEDPKRVAKLVISIFASLQKQLSSNEEDPVETIKTAYASLGIDVASHMNAWNPMRGLSALEDSLKDNALLYLAPYLKMEMKLKDLLQDAPSGQKVLELLQTVGTIDEGLLRTVVRESLDWVLMTPSDTENVKELFSSVIGVPLGKVSGSGVPKDTEMGALLEAQFFVTKNMEILPQKQIGSFDKPGAIAFDLLFDSEIVSRDTFLRWKEDTGRSVRVPEKDKMVIQTSKFFHWLAQLQQ